MLTERCVKGITANEKHCESLVHDSIAIVTVFSPYTGYEKSSSVAKQALTTGGSVVDIIRAFVEKHAGSRKLPFRRRREKGIKTRKKILVIQQ